MRPMAPNDILVIAACLMFGFGIVAFLFGRFFCASEVPRWMKWWRDLAVALIGARIIGARVFDIPLDYFGALLWLNLGISQGAIALYRWRNAVGPGGDRCVPAIDE